MDERRPHGQDSSNGAALKGSDILLRKLPLYAQAQQFLQSDLHSARNEVNVLSYGPSTYPVLGLVRACRVASLASPTAPPRASTVTPLLHDPFSGIQDSGLYQLPLPRKWQGEQARVAGSPPAAAPMRDGWRRERALLEAAVAPLTGPRLVARSLRPTAVALGREALRLRRKTATTETDADAAPAEGKDSEQRPTTAERARGEAKVDGVDQNEEHEHSDPTELEQWFASQVELPAAGRKRQRPEDSQRWRATSRATSNLLSFLGACPDETALLSAIHTASAAADETAEAASGVTLTAPEQWGSRMLTLLTSAPAAATTAPAAASGAESEGQRQQMVGAYLKRVTWLSKQRAAAVGVGASLSTLYLGGNAPSPAQQWAALSAAERVQREMAYATGQRERFRRVRGKTAEADGDDGDSGNANDGKRHGHN